MFLMRDSSPGADAAARPMRCEAAAGTAAHRGGRHLKLAAIC